jgi:hypothetical protein
MATQTRISGFLYRRELEDGREIVVYPMIYTDRICIGVSGEGTYERAWCYPKGGLAATAAEKWDGEGDPPDGWVKEVGIERRRVDGDPAKEFDASKKSWPA